MTVLANPEIVDLLSDAEQANQCLGLAMLGDRPEEYAVEIMESFTRIPRVADSLLAAYCRSRFPFFATGFEPGRVVGDVSFRVGDRVFRRERVFLQGVEKWLASTPPGDIGRCLSLLAGQHVLHGEYERIIKARYTDMEIDRFRAAIRSQRGREERQLGFAPTFRCNLSCPYCMSAPLMRQEADFATVRKVIDWASRAGVQKLRLYGGEPCLYPEFARLLSEAREAGLRVYMASNLVASEEAVSAVGPDVVDCVAAHTRSPSVAGSQGEVFKANALRIRRTGVEVLPRYNLVDEDWSFLRDIAGLLQVDRVSFAPVVTRCESVIPGREKWLADVRLACRFMEYLSRHGLRPVLAKPLPLCCVEQMELSRWDVFDGVCTAYRDGFTFNVLVHPDTKIGLCDADHGPDRPSLDEFTSWDDLQSYVAPRMRAWLRGPLWPECSQCYYGARALCQGACLAAKPFHYSGADVCSTEAGRGGT
ncbi:MAG: radical SAM protein [Sedimentisphaerales bacterium]|nr:radical SAM protein [Sedimentisphaerales bacterium]